MSTVDLDKHIEDLKEKLAMENWNRIFKKKIKREDCDCTDGLVYNNADPTSNMRHECGKCYAPTK